ncbi:MAG: hypothetical protein RIR97_866 [Pseudomonadota bacterium]
MAKNVLVLGGAHVDRRGRLHGPVISGASNPGHWFEEAGGGAFNVARNLARLGHQVTMVSPRGGDTAGDSVAAAALEAGVIDRPFIFLDRKTPSYTAILSEDGNLVIALADMDLYRLFSPRRLSVKSVRMLLDAADMVVCDANLPAETLAAIAEQTQRRGIPLAAIAITPAKVVRLRSILSHLHMLFLNQAEARALVATLGEDGADLLLALKNAGLSGAVVTNGSGDAHGWQGADSADITPPDVDIIGDVTGAGDALAAGVVHGLLQGKRLEDSLKMGTACAIMAVRSPLATPPSLSPETLTASMALVADAKSPA